MRMLDNSVSQTFHHKHTSSDISAQHHIISSNYITVIVFQGFRTGYTYVQPLERIEPARLANDVSLNIFLIYQNQNHNNAPQSVVEKFSLTDET